MAAALLVVPGLAAAWLWVAPRGRVAAARQLAAAGAALVAVGLAWPVLVWLTPAADRPWVVRHRRQLDLVAHPRLQRPRPAGGQSGGPGGAPAARAGPAAARAACSAAAPVPCACSTAPSGARPAGCSAPRSSAAVLLVATRACAAPTRARAGRSPSAARSRSPRSPSARPPGSSTPTTSRPWRRSPRRSSAPVRPRSRGRRVARIAGPLLVAGGVVTELMVLDDQGGRLGWLPPVLVAAGVVGAFAVAAEGLRPRLRALARRRRARRPAHRARLLVGADARPRHERDVPGRRAGLGRGHGRRRRRSRRRRPRGGGRRGAARPAAGGAGAPGRGGRRRHRSAATRPR